MIDSRTLFVEEYKVRGNETDRTGKLSLQALTNLLQETAGNHAKKLGFSVEELQKQGISWLLYRIQLSIQVWPVYGDVLRIETWPSGIRTIYAFREFEVFRGSEKIGSASTAWLVFNLSKRKLIKIPVEFGQKIPATEEGPRIRIKEFISEVKDADLKTNVTVGWPHLDLNNHTNNVHYYSWMMMATPEKIHENRKLTFMDAIFKGETGLGDEIIVESKADNNNFLYKLTLSSNGKEVLLANTIWE